MGDKTPATTTQNQTTSSTTDPWSAATPLLQSLISQYGSQSTSPTTNQTTATGNLVTAANSAPNMTAPSTAAIQQLFSNAGTPLSTMGTANSYLNPIASANLNPMNTPGFSDALNTMNTDITNQTKGMYAAAGRDPSGAGSMPQTLARGLSQGEGGLIANQYNANVGNATNAANAMVGNANSATGASGSSLNSGLAGAGMLTGIATSPATAQVAAANTQQALPYQDLLQQLQAAGMLGTMGSSTNSTGTAVGTQTPANNPLNNWISGAGLGLGMVGTMMSDRDAKTDIREVGKLHDGQTVHAFRMKGDPRTQIGLIAQDVEKKRPEAVVRDSQGMRHVHYGLATRFAGAGMGKAA
jgi:hypothetical protein